MALRRSVLDKADAVVLLHSIFSNEPLLSRRELDRVARSPAPKAVFLGNEYKLMPEKMEFAEAANASLVVSQLSSPDALALYRERLRCAVVGIPNTGFDPDVFAPTSPPLARPIAVGYRGFANPLYLGHDERTEIAARVGAAARARGLVTDISLDAADRFDEAGWAAFLNSCRGQIGSEAGADYFELTDVTRDRVRAYERAYPGASLPEIRAACFEDGRSVVSGRALSGRIVEAAATKTAQILLEGEYGGFFRPGEHYVPLRHDFSNVEEALDRLCDDAECIRIADAAYEVARAELTYEHLLDRFHDALVEVIG